MPTLRSFFLQSTSGQWRIAAAAVVLMFGPMEASALEPSGHAVEVKTAVNATGPGGRRIIELQGAVFMGDEIVASSEGLAQIIFIDDTRIVIGPRSRLTIDRFVFNPDYTAKDISIKMIKGSFRFISGKSRPGAYTLSTPTATAGIRG